MPNGGAVHLDKSSSQHRIAHLDGLRGLAILAVVFYHCYSRWPDVPKLYTRAFSQGYLGVQLFFLLSGFLIFMSLETSSSLGHFLYRRWLRLFPAMAVVSLLIYLTSIFLYNRVEALPGYLDALPGLLFIEPHWLRDIFGLKVTGPLEGDFWTLFTEVKFYVLFGVTFFVLRRHSVFLLAALSVFGAIVYLLQMHGIPLDSGTFSRASVALCDELNCRCYGWFAAGAFFYLFFESGRRWHFAASAFCAAIGIVANANLRDPADVAFCSGVYLIFIAPFFWGTLKNFFSRPEPVFFGFISYPLYLLHENASWAITLRLNAAFPSLPARLVPLFPILLVCILAWMIAAYIEPLGRQIFSVGRRPVGPADRSGLFQGGRAAACALLALLAAVLVTLSLFQPIRSPRLALEEQILASEKESLVPLELKLSDTRQALARVREARIQAQAYLDSMVKSAP
jgi:peptidoglycan/LPS O-acetylase OafA/YrhL